MTAVLQVRIEQEENVGGGEMGPETTRVRLAVAFVPNLDWEGRAPNADGLDWKTSWATSEGVRRMTAEVRSAAPTAKGCDIDVARPQRLRVPYGAVLTVLRALRDEGVGPVEFVSRSMALPGDR